MLIVYTFMQINGIINYMPARKSLYASMPMETKVNPFLPNTVNLNRDTVSFTAANSKPLENLYQYGLRCIYTNIIMINSPEVLKLISSGAFNGDSKGAVNIIEGYKKNLFEHEKKILKILKKESEKQPKASLSSLMKSLYDTHKEKLRKAQNPIFKSIVNKAKNLPENYKEDFKEFMEITGKKLDDKPAVYKFSPKEFAYKIEKMMVTIGNKKDKDQLEKYIRTLQSDKLKKAPDIIDLNTIDDILQFNSPRYNKKSKIMEKYKNNPKHFQKKDVAHLRKKIAKTDGTIYGLRLKFMLSENETLSKKELYSTLINSIKSISNRYNDKGIRNLCEISENMIQEKPAIIKFSRKTFIYDLSRVLNKLPDEALRREMINLAISLPTSAESVSAFITKNADLSSDKIAYSLLSPSFASIEHIKPDFLGGASDMSNYTVASRRYNSLRQHGEFDKFLAKFPKENPQKAFDIYIRLANEGLIEPKYVIGMKNAIKKQGKITLNDSKLNKSCPIEPKKKLIKHCTSTLPILDDSVSFCK